MNLNMRVLLPTLLLGVVAAISIDDIRPQLTKTWLGDMNLLNGRNWNVQRAPCRNDRAILPVSLELAVRLPDGETSLRQLVLPRDGEVLLPKVGALTVGDSDKLQSGVSSCPGEGKSIENTVKYTYTLVREDRSKYKFEYPF
ncbi:uncharacterized protein LOC120351255 [Nilaparvata lugens]|uniref:uncharacterized protein LOC120351255 n=1 Tax=Nilaparvata lugens TaxID=108931 RepID=UPI00193D4255|nr:uncharacterized protein LOC120351255 [Nilaparvata lugens]